MERSRIAWVATSQDRLHGGSHLQGGGERGRSGLAHQPLGHAGGPRRGCGNALRELAHFGIEPLLRHHARDQAQAQRLGGVDELAGQRHSHGLGGADQARQEPGATDARDQPQAQEAFGELGAVARDADVAHQSQVAPGAQGQAVDAGDDGDFQRLDRPRDAVQAAAQAFADFGGRALHQVASVTHVLDVAAGAEVLATAADHHAAQRGVVVRGFQRGSQLHRERDAHRVAALGIVQDDGQDVVRPLASHKVGGLGHGAGLQVQERPAAARPGSRTTPLANSKSMSAWLSP
jgi:hypothetical protein